MSDLGMAVMRSRVRDYVRIARPDHWVKNIFMIPGWALAYVLAHNSGSVSLWRLIVGVISCCLVASANYSINEYLDAPFDRLHPLKRSRPGAEGRLDGRLVAIQYGALALIGLALAMTINLPFLVSGLWLLVMGLIYNVEPLRTKDRQYLDVLSE